MCKVIDICNQKGGVSKTTTTANLGVGLVRAGKKVLVIDADPQGNLSQSLGIENPDELEVALPNIMEQIIMDKEVDVTKGIIHHKEGLDLMPCNIDLSGVDVSLVNAMSREFVLKTYVDSMREFYDYILIDCMPTITLEYLNEETKGRLNLLKTGEVLKGWDKEKQEFIFEDVKLDGVEFTLYADGDIMTQDGQNTDNARDTWFKDGDKVAVLTTEKGVEFISECGGITGYTMDEDGTIHVSLPLGKYKLKETKTPYGYVYPDTKEWSLEFKWQDGKDEYVLNSTDATDDKGLLHIKKRLRRHEAGIAQAGCKDEGIH